MKNNKEIEVKFKVTSVKFHELCDLYFDKERGDKIQVQKDTYFNTQNAKTRLRVCSDGSQYGCITVKSTGEMVNGILVRDEFEPWVLKEQIPTWIALLNALGFHKTVTVEKWRSDHRIGRVTMSLDNVLNLGYFVELEVSDESDMGEIDTLIEKFGLDKFERCTKGYSDLMMEKMYPYDDVICGER
jgi:predicted adenylyl cyclase CyaB